MTSVPYALFTETRVGLLSIPQTRHGRTLIGQGPETQDGRHPYTVRHRSLVTFRRPDLSIVTTHSSEEADKDVRCRSGPLWVRSVAVISPVSLSGSLSH